MRVSPIFLPFALAGAMFAQSATTPQTAQPESTQPETSQQEATQPNQTAKQNYNKRSERSERMVNRLAKDLNLSQDQQTQAKTIFRDSWQQSKALQPKLREERQALSSAVKTNNEGQISEILQQNAQLNAQAEAVHAKAMAKFYQTLNPDQKTKFDQHAEMMFMGPVGHMRAHQNASTD